MNEEGFLTEGAITNVFVCIEGHWHTPSLARHDVLPGVWRRHFRAETGARESGLHLDDLARAERVVIGNSVRGAIEVEEVVTGEGTLWKRGASPTEQNPENGLRFNREGTEKDRNTRTTWHSEAATNL